MGIKTKVLNWAKKVGTVEARQKLEKAGIKYSTAAKLVTGHYLPEPKTDIVQKIDKAMK